MPGTKPPKKGYPCFVIKKDDTYYLTTGPLLEYNMKAAEASGKEDKKAGVKQMEKDYQRAHDSEHTYYHAVDFTQEGFSGVNTGEKPKP